jgi:hypothetical protein
MDARIGEGSQENPVPRAGRILPISARHLFRLVGKWENRLRR